MFHNFLIVFVLTRRGWVRSDVSVEYRGSTLLVVPMSGIKLRMTDDAQYWSVVLYMDGRRQGNGNSFTPKTLLQTLTKQLMRWKI